MMSMAEMQRRGIDGMCRVMVADDSMGAGFYAYDVVVDWVSKAVAKSIVRHMVADIRKQEDICGCEIDIHYYYEDRDAMEPTLDHWA